MVRVREVTTKGVGWASGEASDLVAPPLNLVLYMYLRIFVYTSNDLISSFEYMELILASGNLKHFRFLLRSCLSTDRAPVIKLNCSTCQDWLYLRTYCVPEGSVLVLGCTLGPDEVPHQVVLLVALRNCENTHECRYLVIWGHFRHSGHSHTSTLCLDGKKIPGMCVLVRMMQASRNWNTHKHTHLYTKIEQGSNATSNATINADTRGVYWWEQIAIEDS